MSEQYPRDLRGYGANPPHPQWPGNARIAVSFVLNVEEGGERNILDGDAASEDYLVELTTVRPLPNQRNSFAEDIFEYGSRAGFWRVLRLFKERNIHFTSWAVGIALGRNPEAAIAMVEAGHEVASHGWRWIDYSIIPEEIEREDIRKTVDIIQRFTGERPRGWYTGRYSSNTLRLLIEAGGFDYYSDVYSDDLPFWRRMYGQDLLFIPYALDTNDFKFSLTPGWMSGDDFYLYLKAAFDFLYREGATAPKMMSVGLHSRFTGHPGRADALARFMDYVLGHDDVWIPRRFEIAQHWRTHFPVPDTSDENSNE